MALVGCRECGAQVSDQAFKCVQCGVQLRKPTRSFIGKTFKYLFIVWNIFMAYAFFKGMGAASEMVANTSNSAQQAGAAIGTGIGATMIISLWAFGSFILGIFVLFTRPKSS